MGAVPLESAETNTEKLRRAPSLGLTDGSRQVRGLRRLGYGLMLAVYVGLLAG
jgi:hypothetical protein